jgi:xanthine permease XanP
MSDTSVATQSAGHCFRNTKLSKRPRHLLFARDEQPPRRSILGLALQHSALSIVFLFYAVVIAKGAGFTPLEQQSLLVGTLLACGIGAMLQAGSAKVSSGLLMFPLATPISFAFAIEAGRQAGPAGIATLAIVGGIIQIVVGRGLRHLRPYLPPEVVGVVVLALGISIVPAAFDRILGLNTEAAGPVFDASAITVGLLTLMSIAASSIWLKGTLRLFSMLIGCVVGYATSIALGNFGNFGEVIASSSTFALPHLILPSFDLKASFLLAFVCIAIVSAVDDIGVIVSTDRLDDANWSKPNIPQISRGVSSFGAANILGGLIGSTFLGLSSSNVGLAFATGVTSRIVGLAAGSLMILLSFFPKVLAVVAAMPEPVLGGVLAYAAGYFIVSGAELALARMMSPRRMLVVGLSIAGGIAVVATPEIAEQAHEALMIILESPLVVASLLAIALNAIMRIGIAQKTQIVVSEGADRHDQIADKLEEWGEIWGLNRATVVQATAAVNQLIEAIEELKEGDAILEARHDDVNLDIRIIYKGQPMMFPDKAPTADELMNDPDGVSRMAGWLLRHLADRASAFVEGDQQGVMLRFES